MKVKVNGEKVHFEKELTIDQLMDRLEISRQHGFAVAHNDSVVPKNRLAETVVKDGDKLEIIHATAGG